jgi:hypothetical protein
MKLKPISPIVVIDLPKVGLGNKLSIWARGYLFSSLNKMPIFVLGWLSLSIGPWIKFEKKKDFILIILLKIV